MYATFIFALLNRAAIVLPFVNATLVHNVPEAALDTVADAEVVIDIVIAPVKTNTLHNCTIAQFALSGMTMVAPLIVAATTNGVTSADVHVALMTNDTDEPGAAERVDALTGEDVEIEATTLSRIDAH